MDSKLLDLRPDKNLQEANFNGYKLSLEQINTVFKKKLLLKPNVECPTSNQHTLQHVKLFITINNLIGESVGNIDLVYFVNKNYQVIKGFVNLDPLEQEANANIVVWKMPILKQRQAGDYNVSIKLPTENLGVISDGMGTLFVVERVPGDLDSDCWKTLFNAEVLGQDKCFHIENVQHKINIDNKRELHCLLLCIEEARRGVFYSMLYWVTLTEIENKKWGQTAIRHLQSKGEVFYSFFEKDCDALYIISDNSFKFTLDSEHPVDKDIVDFDIDTTYSWFQNETNVMLMYNLPDPEDIDDDIDVKDVEILTTDESIKIKYLNEIQLEGDFFQRIDSKLTMCTLNKGVLKIILYKLAVGLMWSEFIPGNDAGIYIVDPNLLKKIEKTIEESTAMLHPSDAGINNVIFEEYGFLDNKFTILQRVKDNHQVTHSARIATREILFTIKMCDENVPAFVLRHDVDACIWQPQKTTDDKWNIKHEGTLPAFGYIQDSKDQKKFCTCAPDLSYSVICESNNHIFIYRQKKAVTSGELRNRATGRKVENIALQQVINIERDEVLGIHTTNHVLFVLTEAYLYALRIN